jgi:hypothetical protein
MLSPVPRILIFFLLLSLHISSQDYLYEARQIKIETGKHGNSIRSIVRDRAGLIWLGTIRGLVRFNGYEFDKPLDAISDWQLPSRDVFTLAIGGDSLFIGTQKGVKILDVGTFRELHIPGYKDNGAAILIARHDPSSGFWWVREDGFLFHMFRGKIRAQHIDLVKPIDLRISGDHILISGNIRLEKGVSKLGSIYRIDKQTFRVREELRSRADFENPVMYEEQSGRIVYMHGGKAIRLPSKGSDIGEWYSATENFEIRNEAGDHRFMVANQHQLIHEYKSGNNWRKNIVNLGISVPYVIYCFMISGDRVLLGTSVGLINLVFRKNEFVPIRSTLVPKVGIYEDPRGIAEDDENIYIAGYHSISAWRKSDSTLRLINAKDLLTHGMILYDRRLWLATEGNGLIRIDPLTGSYEYLAKDTSYRNNFLISTAAWGDTILIGGYNSVDAYLPEKKAYLSPVIIHDSIVVSDLMVKKILPLDKNKCLLGTDKGIFIIGRDFRVLQHIRPGDRNERPGNDIINDVIPGPDGKMWAATFDGIWCFASNGKVIRSIRRQDGLAGDFVASLAVDSRGGIWAGTYEGLSRIDTATGRIDNFYKADGLPDDEFNHSSVHVARSGNIFMGTVSGFIRFDPNMSLRNSGSQKKINISRLEYGRNGDVSVHLDVPGSETESLHMGPDIKYLKLHFFTDPVYIPEQASFEYKIDGIHERWMKMGPTPILHIDNVRSGRYTLHVRFITGVGSEEILERQFPLLVEQYFYTKPAFYVGIISTLLIFITLYIRTIMLRDRRLLEVRQELAADLHDEVGGYLAGMLMKIDLMLKSSGVRESQLSTLRNLASRAVFGLKDGLWSLDTKTDNAQQLWDRYKRIAQESLEPFDIPYKFSSSRGLGSVPLTLIEKRNLLFTLKECLNNAIKHGDGKGVWFEWKTQNDGKHNIIVRNGIRSSDREDDAEGLGLENMQRRIQRINGSLQTGQSNGMFTVEIKINLRHDKIGRD